MTKIGLRKQTHAHEYATKSSDASIHMSALLPGPVAQGSTIKILVDAHVTSGSPLARKQSEGCTAGGLAPGASPGRWVQSLRRIPISSAWATLPLNDAE